MLRMGQFRVFLGHVMVEAPTVEDVVRLARLYQHQPEPAASPRPAPPTLSLGPFLRPEYLKPKAKSPVRAVFANGHYAAYEALYAGTDGITTEDLVKALGVKGPKSIPPTVAAWGKRARAANLGDFRELFEVERGYFNGKPHTIYRFTAKGREVFQPETEQAQASGALGL
jgi:hypothetical protein